MGKNVFKIDERNLWREKRARFDRFGFEVLPDDAVELTDDDDLSYGQVFRTVFSLLVIVFIGYAGLIIYERLDGFSLASLFERKIDESALELLAPEPEIKATKQFPSPEVPAEPESEPQKRLFNPDGTMKASFPLPPGGPPKDYYVPGQETGPSAKPPINPPGYIDTEREAYDPAAASTARRNPRKMIGRAKQPATPRTIGAYEVFDPERDAVKSDWEFFEDPRP